MIDAMKTFNLIEEFKEETIQHYINILPPELISVWREKGLGTLLNGYLKIINPDDYRGLLKDTYFNAENAIPIMATAFGDLIIWQDNRLACILKYRYGTFDAMIPGMKLFLRCLGDESFWKYHFSIDAYNEALEVYGPLQFDECFGYTPILAVGGPERVDHLKKVKIKEHIAVIAQFTGGI